MQLFAKLLKILPVQSGTGPNGPWKKRDIIVESLDQYHNKICVSIWIEKIDLKDFSTGDSIKISYYLSSKESNGRWFTQVIAIWIEKYDPDTEQDEKSDALSDITNDLVMNASMLSFDPEIRKQFGFYDNMGHLDPESVIFILTHVFNLSSDIDSNKLRLKVLNILRSLYPGEFDNISLAESGNSVDKDPHSIEVLEDVEAPEEEPDWDKVKSSGIMTKEQMQDFLDKNQTAIKFDPEKIKKLKEDLKGKLRPLTDSDEDDFIVI